MPLLNRLCQQHLIVERQDLDFTSFGEEFEDGAHGPGLEFLFHAADTNSYLYFGRCVR